MNLSGHIDHTYLKSDATKEIIKRLCQEAIEHTFFSVCLNPCWISLAKDLLKDSSIKVCTVVGFPLGSNLAKTKEQEAKDCLNTGADELDMVANISYLKEMNEEELIKDSLPLIDLCRQQGKLLKVILETCLLTPQEIAFATKLYEKLGAHFVKTSTGFSSAGASLEAVRIMKENSSKIKIKASGGIKTKEQALGFIHAGADRLGCSASVEIVRL